MDQLLKSITSRGNENSKVVALAKNSDRLKPQQPRARFAQQTPRSKRFEIQIRLQVYQRARYYDCSTGEFTSQDPLGYVDGNSLFRAYFVPGIVDPGGDETWDVDKANCVITRQIKVGFYFSNTREISWLDGDEDHLDRKRRFMEGFKRVVEKAFNNTKFKIHPARKIYYKFGLAKCNCPCPNGLSVEVNINWTTLDKYLEKGNNDFAIDVLPKGANRRKSKAQLGGPKGWLLETDNQPTTHTGRDPKKKFQQITSVHEFGHLIGLRHPNAGRGTHDSGDREDYHTPKDGKDKDGRVVSESDLMGVGMGMREFYFDAWENKANNVLDKKCAPWTVK